MGNLGEDYFSYQSQAEPELSGDSFTEQSQAEPGLSGDHFSQQSQAGLNDEDVEDMEVEGTTLVLQ